ncbi:hypothetical protein PIB30_086020, partial [Stylosanthes scabra]|nr:hypothetical protein [Stylosanthes scabra]
PSHLHCPPSIILQLYAFLIPSASQIGVRLRSMSLLLSPTSVPAPVTTGVAVAVAATNRCCFRHSSLFSYISNLIWFLIRFCEFVFNLIQKVPHLPTIMRSNYKTYMITKDEDISSKSDVGFHQPLALATTCASLFSILR